LTLARVTKSERRSLKLWPASARRDEELNTTPPTPLAPDSARLSQTPTHVMRMASFARAPKPNWNIKSPRSGEGESNPQDLGDRSGDGSGDRSIVIHTLVKQQPGRSTMTVTMSTPRRGSSMIPSIILGFLLKIMAAITKFPVLALT